MGKVSLYKMLKFVCIHRHCTYGNSAGAFVVRAGSLRARTDGQSRTVSQVRQHPQYNANTVDNDVSVLVVTKIMHYVQNYGSTYVLCIVF